MGTVRHEDLGPLPDSIGKPISEMLLDEAVGHIKSLIRHIHDFVGNLSFDVYEFMDPGAEDSIRKAQEFIRKVR